MAIHEPWEYESDAPRAPAEPPCACRCHAELAPVIAPYGASCRTAQQEAAVSRQPAENYVASSDHPARPYAAFSERPANGPQRRSGGNLLVQRGTSIVGCLLAMFLLADVGVNIAHNTGAVVSRIVPLMPDRPFYFDPLAIVHDAEDVLH